MMSSKEFQFHKGTIRTKRSFFSSLDNGYFNSIKVRLEQALSDARTFA